MRVEFSKKQVDQRAAAQQSALLVALPVRLDIRLGEVEHVRDLVRRKPLDPEQMAMGEGGRDADRTHWRRNIGRALRASKRPSPGAAPRQNDGAAAGAAEEARGPSPASAFRREAGPWTRRMGRTCRAGTDARRPRHVRRRSATRAAEDEDHPRAGRRLETSTAGRGRRDEGAADIAAPAWLGHAKEWKRRSDGTRETRVGSSRAARRRGGRPRRRRSSRPRRSGSAARR